MCGKRSSVSGTYSKNVKNVLNVENVQNEYVNVINEKAFELLGGFFIYHIHIFITYTHYI
jgi:hypothetical protein